MNEEKKKEVDKTTPEYKFGYFIGQVAVGILMACAVAIAVAFTINICGELLF